MGRKYVISLATVLVLLVLVLMALPVHAQYRASLQGDILDAQGAMVPGAQVTLTDKNGRFSINTETGHILI